MNPALHMNERLTHPANTIMRNRNGPYPDMALIEQPRIRRRQMHRIEHRLDLLRLSQTL